jgi:S-(hydroxymethyl)glutathione synthase
MSNPSLHQAIDNGIQAGSDSFAGGKLTCHCDANAVEVMVTAQSAHNHVVAAASAGNQTAHCSLW